MTATAMPHAAEVRRAGPEWLRRNWVWLAATLVVVLPLADVASRYAHTSYFYDEWGLIGRVALQRTSLGTAFASFNGHLWVLDYVVYWAQARLLGFHDHVLVYLGFGCGLVGLHLALATVLRALRLPLLVAVLAAAVVVYFGPGAQTMVFEFELGTNVATALCLAGAAVVLRNGPSRRTVALVGGLLLLALGCDSGVAGIGLLFVAVLVLGRWRSWLGAAALVPAVLAGLVWSVTGAGSGPHRPASLHQQRDFAVRLVLRAVGGLAGGGELVGAALLGALAVIILVALRARSLPEPTGLGLAAGGAAVLAATVLLTRTRAGIVGTDFNDYNRYLQFVAVYALIAFAPVLYTTAAAYSRWAESVTTGVATVLLAAVLLANTSSLQDYRRTFEGWNASTRAGVAASVAVLDAGCPGGAAPDVGAQPLGTLDPQITVQLLETLRRRGWIGATRHVRIPAAVRAAICPPARPAGATTASRH